jgi:hypothetical protein
MFANVHPLAVSSPLFLSGYCNGRTIVIAVKNEAPRLSQENQASTCPWRRRRRHKLDQIGIPFAATET